MKRCLLLLLVVFVFALSAAAEEPPGKAPPEGEINLLEEMTPEGAVEIPERLEGPIWTVGGPISLALFFVFLVYLNKVTVPFAVSKESLTLYHYPTGVRRGLAFAICLYGIAFLLGAFEIVYRVNLHGSSHAYFEQMTLGKMIAFTHAHLFGFVTSFLVIGVPFSMQFNHLASYQWIFPIGLAACFVDIIAWWGIKYVGQSFVPISITCGILFSASYLYMLVGLLRVLLFPQVVWPSDKDWPADRDWKEGARRKM